jgi:hypothetical protein
MLYRALLSITLLTSPILSTAAQAEDGPAAAVDEKRPTTAQEAPAEGTLIAYLDDEGQLHVVNSMEAVPQQYRSRARPAELGEVSTISAGRAPQGKTRRSRSTPRPRSQAPGTASARDGRRSEARAPGEQGTLPERLAKLRERRAKVVDELGLLNEGWLPPPEKGEAPADATGPSLNKLEERSASLSKQLDALDRKIAGLEAKQ